MLEVSISPLPRLPAKVRARIEALGPGRVVRRADVRRLVGSPSATSMFLADAMDRGLLVPVRWGAYQVVDEATARLVARVRHGAARRLIAWAEVLPAHAGRPVAFLAPRLWRDTPLNVGDPLPVLGLRPRDRALRGCAPQWGALFADLEAPERWWLRVGDERVGPLGVPSLPDTRWLLRAAADPRWVGAALALGMEARGRLGSPAEPAPAGVWVAEAPRGRQVRRLGLGPPHRRRLLAPPWWIRMRSTALEASAGGSHG